MDRRITRTRAAIQSAYFELLTENRSGRLTVSDIARRANIDRKTFYLHYTTPDEIIREYFRDKAQALMQKLNAHQDESFSIARLFESMNQLIAENMHLLEAISAQENRHYFTDLIKDLLVEAVMDTSPELLPFSETELRVFSEFYLSGIMACYTLWINSKLPLTAIQLASLVSDASVRGLENLISERRPPDLAK